MAQPDTSRRQYARRMNRVLDHIDAHLDDPLDLEALAALAHFSPFHFHPTAWRAGSTERWGRYLQAQREQLAQLRKLDQDGRSVGSEDGDSCNFIESHTMHVEIKTLAPQRIAYLRYIGAYGPAVTQFWGEKVAPWMQAEGLLGRPSYGISHDDPSVTPADRRRYDAAVAVPPDYRASGEARPAASAARSAFRWSGFEPARG